MSESGDIQTFVLFVPTLGAEERHVQPAMKFLDGSNVHYYWDATGITMKRFGRALGMDLDLWDFWAIYLPSTQWTGETPPAPEFWQHQLTGLPEEKRLDVGVFIARIKELRDELLI